jgi:hypothetical protein
MKKNAKLDKLNKENGSLKKQLALLKKENKKVQENKEKDLNGRSSDHKKIWKYKKTDKRFSRKELVSDDRTFRDGISRIPSKLYIQFTT